MNEELAQRAVACKHWRWMPGMQSINFARFLGGDSWAEHGGSVVVFVDTYDADLPDLDDPATLGCLLALVREAHGGKPVWLSPDTREHGNEILEWEVCVFVGGFASETLAFGPTEAAALVAALEAAP